MLHVDFSLEIHSPLEQARKVKNASLNVRLFGSKKILFSQIWILITRYAPSIVSKTRSRIRAAHKIKWIYTDPLVQVERYHAVAWLDRCCRKKFILFTNLSVSSFCVDLHSARQRQIISKECNAYIEYVCLKLVCHFISIDKVFEFEFSSRYESSIPILFTFIVGHHRDILRIFKTTFHRKWYTSILAAFNKVYCKVYQNQSHARNRYYCISPTFGRYACTAMFPFHHFRKFEIRFCSIRWQVLSENQ